MTVDLKTGFATVALSTLLLACTPAGDQKTATGDTSETDATSEMSGGMAAEKMSGQQTPFGPSEDKMHQGMMQASGADVQETYALKMIEHHRGAVEMSQVVLRENPEPELRRMAEKTIADQGREITMLEEWIAAHRARDTSAMPTPARPTG